jgi:hypothetical protein
MSDDPINPLERQISERMPWLFSDYGFRVVDYSYDSRSFGNCIVTMESETLLLRFHKDRGIGYAELASQTDREYWFDLSLLLRPILGERPDPNFEGTAVLLKNNFPALVQALGPKFSETKREGQRRKEEVRESLSRMSMPIKGTFRGTIYKTKQTSAGRMLLRLLRLMEVALVLWALYVIVR